MNSSSTSTIDVCPVFQSQTGSSLLFASSPMCNGFLRFTSGATSADLLTTNITANSLDNSHLTSSSMCPILRDSIILPNQEISYNSRNFAHFCPLTQLTQQRIKLNQTAEFLRFNEAHWLHTKFNYFLSQ